MLEIWVDGACRGNPGPASVGVVIKKAGKLVKEVAKEIGTGTNNIAEYTALIYALQEALVLKEEKVKIYTDSELMFKQVTGSYQVKNAQIKLLFDQVKVLLGGFKHPEIKLVPREHNSEADKLASGILKTQAKVVAPLFKISGEESPNSEG